MRLTLPGSIDSWPMDATVTFSDDGVYRYSLGRDFIDIGEGRVTFIMLNPSTADDKVADPTVRRCIVYARDWGYRSLRVVNLFGLRATDPQRLREHEDPIGPENDRFIMEEARASDLVICAWGVHGSLENRDMQVMRSLKAAGIEGKALSITKGGMPGHPLYLSKWLQPIPYV